MDMTDLSTTVVTTFERQTQDCGYALKGFLILLLPNVAAPNNVAKDVSKRGDKDLPKIIIELNTLN